MVSIGPYPLSGRVLLAPMAGVTDRPFRNLCRRLGAALAVSEMISADPALRDTRLSRLRRDHRGEPEPRSVQIAGADPEWMAEAARMAVAGGAQIVDINMGCPAKRVCNRLAGSALLSDPGLVREILQAVVASVTVPVTLKIRTGPDPEQRNGVAIAGLARDCGIQALAVHGRTRADRYRGRAEYRTIADICAAVDLPVFANGDIETPEQAEAVMAATGAAGVMIGRGAFGQPWILGCIDAWISHGRRLPSPSPAQQGDWLLEQVRAMHALYGQPQGLLMARKHIGWTLQRLAPGQADSRRLLTLDDPGQQLGQLAAWLQRFGSCRDAA